MQEKSLVKKNILQYLDIKGISRYKFYQETGITRGVLDQNNGMSEDNTARFLAYYDEINPEWLLTGKGKMLKGENAIMPSSDDGYIGVPLIPFDTVAGYGEEIEGVNYENCEHYRVPEFKYKGVEFVVRVSGSSMYPKFSNGDILACKKITDILFFQWGKVYVIDSSQGQLVKRVFEHEDPEMILLVSENKEKYPPFAIPKSDIRSLNIVLGVIRME